MGAVCKDCGIEYNGFDGRMVMLKDTLWLKVCDHFGDKICDECIETRMGRPIQEDDLLPSDPPVNKDWKQKRGIF